MQSCFNERLFYTVGYPGWYTYSRQLIAFVIRRKGTKRLNHDPLKIKS